MDSNNQPPVFVAVIDFELDLAYLFKDALSQIDGVQVFAFTDPLLALEHFQSQPSELHGHNLRLSDAYYDWDGTVK